LYWLSKGLPGGHKIWNFLDSDIISSHYGKMLENSQMADTLFVSISVS